MALDKVTYVDGVTIITAQNLNDIQDEIIANASHIGDLSALDTTAKTDLVSAINEVDGDIFTIDTALASKADASAVNSALALKADDSKVDELNNDILYVLDKDNALTWEIGWIRASTGADMNDSAGIRTVGWFYADKEYLVTCDDGYAVNAYTYNSASQSSYIERLTGSEHYRELTIPKGKYFRLTASKPPATPVTDVNAISIHVNCIPNVFKTIYEEADRLDEKVLAVRNTRREKRVTWEAGYIKANGTYADDGYSARTIQFVKVPKGSIVFGGYAVSFRVSSYTQPKDSAFVSRSDTFARTNRFFVVENDGYIKVAVNWSPPVEPLSDVAEVGRQIHIFINSDEDTKGLFGAKQFYLSAPTAETETVINNKTLSELYAIYDGLCTTYPNLIRRLPDIGMDASNTYEIREYSVSLKNQLVYEGEVSLSGDLDIEHLTNLWESSMNNPIIGIQIGIHGNEKAPTWGAALAIKEIVESDDDFATFIKSNFELRIIPCANPYGFQNDVRKNSNNVDINRNFNDLTQAEAVAIANWVYGLEGKASLILAVHGTTGYYAYYSVNGNSPYFDDFCNQCMRFTMAVQNDWADFYGVDKAPYCYTVKTTYVGTMGELQNRIGIVGFTLETPQNYGNGGQESWDNDLRSCKLTKDLLINALQNAGEWSVEITP